MDEEEKEWLRQMKKHFEEAERKKDLVPTHTEEALEKMTPEVWDAIVSKKIRLEDGRIKRKELLENHKEMQPITDFLAGKRITKDMTKHDINRVLESKEAENNARLLAGLMHAVDEREELPEEHPAQAASYIRSSLARQHDDSGLIDKIKDTVEDLLDFVGNILASMLGF